MLKFFVLDCLIGCIDSIIFGSDKLSRYFLHIFLSFSIFDVYHCDKQGYCNRVLDFFLVNNFGHRDLHF